MPHDVLTCPARTVIELEQFGRRAIRTYCSHGWEKYDVAPDEKPQEAAICPHCSRSLIADYGVVRNDQRYHRYCADQLERNEKRARFAADWNARLPEAEMVEAHGMSWAHLLTWASSLRRAGYDLADRRRPVQRKRTQTTAATRAAHEATMAGAYESE